MFSCGFVCDCDGEGEGGDGGECVEGGSEDDLAVSLLLLGWSMLESLVAL